MKFNINTQEGDRFIMQVENKVEIPLPMPGEQISIGKFKKYETEFSATVERIIK